MWSKIFNLLFVQLFILQASVFASPGKSLSAEQLQDSVTALKKLSTDEQKRLYLSIIPLINKEDMKVVGDKDFFTSIIKNVSVEGDALIVKVAGEKARITEIDFRNLTARLNGKKFDLKRPINEQVDSLLEDAPKTSFIDFLFPSAHAQAKKPPVPNKLKVIGLVAAGAVVAVLSVGGVALSWLKLEKGSEAVTVQEVDGPSVEDLVTEDCNELKDQVKRSQLGELPQITPEFTQKVKNKHQMMEETQIQAKSLKMTQEEMKWIAEAKDCYEEVIEIIELKKAPVKDDSHRSVKEVSSRPVKKESLKQSSKQ
ncbi:MAG: hypothetical protein ACLGHN_08935 [Bacteriovoracia bacterium]